MAGRLIQVQLAESMTTSSRCGTVAIARDLLRTCGSSTKPFVAPLKNRASSDCRLSLRESSVNAPPLSRSERRHSKTYNSLAIACLRRDKCHRFKYLESGGAFSRKGVIVNTLSKRPFNYLNWRLTRVLLLLCAVQICLVLGCSNDQVKRLTEQVSKQAEKATKKANETVQQIAPQVQVPLGGPSSEATFQVDTSLNIRHAYGQLFVLKPDRKNVLQIRSYEIEAEEVFPSFLFQTQTDAENIEACVGQSFEGKLFIQTTMGGSIWSTADSDQVTLKITGQEQGSLVAEVVSGKLENESGASSPVNGNLRDRPF